MKAGALLIRGKGRGEKLGRVVTLEPFRVAEWSWSFRAWSRSRKDSSRRWRELELTDHRVDQVKSAGGFVGWPLEQPASVVPAPVPAPAPAPAPPKPPEGGGA
jgi:hypothetical protein